MTHSEPHYDVQQLKAIPFSEVAARFGGLERAGSRWKTLCPWHNDSRPSLTLYDANGQNHCHCFACGKGGSVIDYVMQHERITFVEACQWLSHAFGIGEAKAENTRHVAKTTPKPMASATKEYTYIPMDFLKPKVSVSNSFSQCLGYLFDEAQVMTLTESYLLGKYRWNQYDDDVIFASIDGQGRIHNLKLQHYCTDWRSPHFAHCDKEHIYFLGRWLAKQGVVAADTVFDNDCFFGAHLLPQRPYATVALVESPKNAVIAAGAYPELVWVATGSKDMLKKARAIESLRDRDVMVFPDRDAIDEWKNILKERKDLANFTVSDFCESHAPADNAKFDIADYVISQRLSFGCHDL